MNAASQHAPHEIDANGGIGPTTVRVSSGALAKSLYLASLYSKVVAELHEPAFGLVRKSFYSFIKHRLLSQRPGTIGLTAVSLDAAENVDHCGVLFIVK